MIKRTSTQSIAAMNAHHCSGSRVMSDASATAGDTTDTGSSGARSTGGGAVTGTGTRPLLAAGAAADGSTSDGLAPLLLGAVPPLEDSGAREVCAPSTVLG